MTTSITPATPSTRARAVHAERSRADRVEEET